MLLSEKFAVVTILIRIMVSVIYKNFYSRPYRIETMGVCLVTGGYYHYAGTGYQNAYTTIVASAG